MRSSANRVLIGTDRFACHSRLTKHSDVFPLRVVRWMILSTYALTYQQSAKKSNKFRNCAHPQDLDGAWSDYQHPVWRNPGKILKQRVSKLLGFTAKAAIDVKNRTYIHLTRTTRTYTGPPTDTRQRNRTTNRQGHPAEAGNR